LVLKAILLKIASSALNGARFRYRPAALPPQAVRRAGQTEQIAGQLVGATVNDDDSALILAPDKIPSLDYARQGSR
jgi:hypothetical protein